MSDEIIASIIASITTLLGIPITVFWYSHKKSDVRFDELRFEKVIFPALCLFEECSFSFSNSELASQTIKSLKDILTDNRIYAGEKLQQYIYDFDNSISTKNKAKIFNELCEYIIKEYNRLSAVVGLPKITSTIRLKRKWYNSRSILFFSKFLAGHAILLFIVLNLTVIISYCIMQFLEQMLLILMTYRLP